MRKKPKAVRINLTLTPWALTCIRELAQREQRTVAGMLRVVVGAGIATLTTGKEGKG